MTSEPQTQRRRLHTRSRFLISGILLVAALVAGAVLLTGGRADAKEILGRKWAEKDRLRYKEIDHSVFDALLQKYVDQDGLVDYDSWTTNRTDRERLEEYLDSLGRLEIAKDRPAIDGNNRGDAIAFWINAYNAVTLAGILDRYPTESIRDHTPVIGFHIWKDLLLRVGDGTYSLEAIEHEILRKQNEPRIHFAIVCASIGCPRLLDRAYVGDRLDEQLTNNARDFFARPRNFRYDAEKNTVFLSSILKWFKNDFGSTKRQRLESLKPYLPEAAQEIVDDPLPSVRYLDYNWNLNEQ